MQWRMWIIDTNDRHLMSKDDAFRDCVARRSGVPRNTINVPQIYLD